MPAHLFAYCTPQSVVAGEPVLLHASTGAPTTLTVTVTRVGAERVVASRLEPIAIEHHPAPPDAVAAGCDWPATTEITTEPAWPSGYYEVALEGRDGRDRPVRTTAFFVVRPAPGTTRRMLLPLSTNTWNAYNDFGGTNTYTGATRASFERPMAPGLLEKPPGAGRRVAVTNPPDPLQTTHVGYLILNGLTEWAGSAGWPNYEEPFLAWAERAGYEIDVATGADLDRHPEIIEGCRLLLSVGHDEYWSAPQRDTVERHLAGGGHVAFLSGNTCYWQVRIVDDGSTMIAYKQRFEDDPVYGTDDAATTTTLWAHPVTGRPEAALTGVSFTRGGYSRIGSLVPRGAGGYTVHRPEHWLFAGTGLEYGDLLGADATVVGYECDGCDFTMVDGRPEPTGVGGTPRSFEILATAPAASFDRESSMRPVRAGDRSELEFNAFCVLGDDSPEAQTKLAAGHAVLGTYRGPGGGTTVTTGCTDWTYGLVARDPDVERITRNVLDSLG
ncbi:MAG: N,N-dimethylformamidase beta subunit family domain-containing protein [Acidimicrobiia bacterium]